MKVEHPEKLELTNLAKTSTSAVKRLEQKQSEFKYDLFEFFSKGGLRRGFSN